MKDSLSCCVCLKEEPFENNPIVSCDGKNCSTTVHKACYGIQQIPDGAWFCQKCISQERTARVRCELCPSRDGALKHTNKGGWCHIICALFVPGAEFLDPERLESISVDKICNDKLNKMCSICEKNNRLDRATIGACIQCVKSGCKVLFHVTCAQSQGLLTEIVNAKEGVRYVAYCFAHKHKTKHRDFSIRLSNSSHSLTRFDKNKLRQTPPHLEKSDEDCVTPQDISLDTDNSVSSKNINISSSSGNANFSSDSTSFDDSNDRIAPVICSSSEISEFQGKKKVPTGQQFRKSMDVLRPPNITSSEPHLSTDVSSLPPNLCCSDASESVAKEEATVKSNTTGSVASDGSSNRPVKRQATTSSSDIQPKKQKAMVKSEMVVVKQEKIKKTRKVSQSSKSTLLELNSTGKEKKAVPPSRPKSIFSHMSNFIGGNGSGGGSGSGSFTPSTSASTSMIMGTTSTSTTSNKISGATCQSMEELLEWQWDQTGTLLMQQAESSDIASLLSCLHDLKNENEQLLSKQLKLSHRRDHLKAVNAKLQLQLATKTSSNTSLPSINAPPSTNNNLEKTFTNRPPSISNSQTSTKPVPKSHKPIDQQPSHYKAAPLSNIPNGDIRTSRPLSDSKTTFIQPQLQQPSILSNPGWATSSKGGGGESQVNPQTMAFLKHYQQQQQHGLSTSANQTISSTPSVSNIISQTDLVTFLNNQLHSQLASNSQTTAILTATQKPISQDIHIAPNNGNNMELIYQAIQQKKQQQLQQQQQQQQQLQLQQHSLPSHFYYHNPNNKISSSGNTINNLDNSVSQTPENTSK